MWFVVCCGESWLLAGTDVGFFLLVVCVPALPALSVPVVCCQCCSGIIITVMRHGQKDMDQLSKEVVMKLCAEIEKEDAEGDAKEDKK